jgi:diphthamide synthase subunit DPH2
MAMKLFKCTVETYPNNCYVETLLIVAIDKEDAEEQIKDSRSNQDKGSGRINPTYNIKYTSPLEELNINLNKRGIIKVGFGHGDDGREGDD